MTEGDKFELYISSELGYGDSGAGADIPGGAVLIFQMEMVEIQGDKVPALTCKAVDGEGCNDKEKAYVDKMKPKTVDEQKKQVERLNGMMQKKMTDDLMDWIKRRLHILRQLVPVEEEKEL